MLNDVAGDALRNNVRTIAAQLPLWHHAFGERMTGGENYISPPTLAQGVFAALAGGEGLPAADLAGKLDRPWCRADLYYVQKITSLLGRLDAGPPE